MKKFISITAIASLFLVASCSTEPNHTTQSITIEFDVSKGCNPKISKASAGTFSIVAKNTGNRTGELEVFDGDRVKGEAENVPAGESRKFVVKLDEGTYELACGKLNGKVGTLEVSRAKSDGPDLKVSEAKLKDATNLYKSYVLEQTKLLKTSTRLLTDSVRAGDIEQAKKEFGPSREPWERIEPIAELFAKYDEAIDARVDDFESVDDSKFTGFHKIEHGLFELKTTSGLNQIANKLDDDIAALSNQISAIVIDPLDMAKGAQALMEEIANGKITGEEDRYSHTDLYDFNANLDGSVKIIDLLRELIDSQDKNLTSEFDRSIEKVRDRLSTYKNVDDTWQSYRELTDTDRKVLKADIASLSELLSEVPGVLGLS